MPEKLLLSFRIPGGDVKRAMLLVPALRADPETALPAGEWTAEDVLTAAVGLGLSMMERLYGISDG